MRRVKKLSDRAPADAEKLYAEGLALLGKKPLRLNGDKQDAACRAAFAALSGAAEAGHPGAQDMLGRCYEYGLGCRQDRKRMEEWYRRSADAGCAHGMFDVGRMQFFGFSQGKRDEEAGYQWFLRAAWAKDAAAMCHLGDCLLRGAGTSQDRRAAADWYFRAMDAGSLAARYALCTEFYTDAFEDVAALRAKQPAWSAHEARAAAEAGDSAGMVALGACYRLGSGVKKDLRSARKYYLAAAKTLDPCAMYALTELYEEGAGGPLDSTAVTDLLRLAAEQGLPGAMKKFSMACSLAFAAIDAAEEFFAELPPEDRDDFLRDD